MTQTDISPDAAAHDRRQMVGVIMGVVGAFLFSFKSILFKLAYNAGGGVEQMMALRMAFSLPIFIVVGAIYMRRRNASLPSRLLWPAIGLGLLSYYVSTWFDMKGLSFISAQLERLILFTYPALAAFLAWRFLGDRVTWKHVCALLLSYAGLFLLFGREFRDIGDDAVIGGALVFVASITFATYVVFSKPVIAKMGSPLFTSIAMSAAGVAILIHFTLESTLGGWPPFTFELIALGLGLAFISTVAPAFLVAEAIGRIGPGRAAVVSSLGPVFTSGLAVLMLREPFGLEHAAALVLTLAGVLLLTEFRGIRARPTDKSVTGS